MTNKQATKSPDEGAFCGFAGNARCLDGYRIKRLLLLAEGQGFEPWEPRGSPVFKTGAIDHSATPPATVTEQRLCLTPQSRKEAQIIQTFAPGARP